MKDIDLHRKNRLSDINPFATVVRDNWVAIANRSMTAWYDAVENCYIEFDTYKPDRVHAQWLGHRADCPQNWVVA